MVGKGREKIATNKMNDWDKNTNQLTSTMVDNVFTHLVGK